MAALRTTPRAHRDKRTYQLVDLALRTVLRHVPPTLTAESIALRWGYSFQPAPRVIRLRSGLPMQVDPCDHLQILIYYLGVFEPHCLRWLRALLTEGGVFVDLGANVGLYTLEGARRVGPSGRVIAIEAAPMHAERLRANVALSAFEQVAIANVAVGDHEGTAQLSLPHDGNLGMYTIGEVENSDGSVEVPLRRLEDVLAAQSLERIDVVKVDIEGAELGALESGARYIERFRPAFLIEINALALRRCGADPKALRAFFEKLGYRGWLMGRTGLAPLPAPSQHECEECLFVHPDRADHLEILARESALAPVESNRPS